MKIISFNEFCRHCDFLSTEFRLSEDCFRLSDDLFKLFDDLFRLFDDRFRLTENHFRLTEDCFRLTEDRFRQTEDRFRLTEDRFRAFFCHFSTSSVLFHKISLFLKDKGGVKFCPFSSRNFCFLNTT